MSMTPLKPIVIVQTISVKSETTGGGVPQYIRTPPTSERLSSSFRCEKATMLTVLQQDGIVDPPKSTPTMLKYLPSARTVLMAQNLL